MKKTGNVLWGSIFILMGLIIGVNALGIATINVFFDGWWTLFIIVPCAIGLFTDSDKTGNIIGIFAGVSLLLASQGIINFDIIWKLMFPAILIAIGFTLIFKNTKISNEIRKIRKNINEENEYWATFAYQNIDFKNEEFKGCELNAIFGGIKCDLRKAIIKEDVVINASAIFGGIEILMPDDVIVKVKSTPIFGATTNKASDSKNDKAHTIYVNSVSIFGGVEIR